MANVICCSIESEPRTLSERQLNQAREIAADVVKKLEAKEASDVFTKGLEPVQKHMEVIDEGGNDKERADCKEKNQALHCQCSCANINVGSPEPVVSREPLSAPF